MANSKKSTSKPYPVRIDDEYMEEIQAFMAETKFSSFGELVRVSIQEKMTAYYQEQRIQQADIPAILQKLQHLTQQATAPLQFPKRAEDKTDYPKT